MMSKISQKVYNIIHGISMAIPYLVDPDEKTRSEMAATIKACREIEQVLSEEFVTKYLRSQDCIIMEVTFNTSFELSVSHKYKGSMHTGYNPIGRFMEKFFETVEWNRLVTINEIINE